MNRYRKKPVEIEAIRVPDEGGEFTPDEVHWLPDGVERTPDGSVFIHTLEGIMEARPGDWIIRGVKGEFYPCKPDIFAATYDAV